MATIRIGGTNYSAALTVNSALKLMEKYGDIKSALTVLQSREPKDALVGSMDILAILLAGGAEHDSLVTRERRESLAADEIRAMVFPSEIPALRGEAIKVMLDGLRREIEAEEDKKKESLAPPG